MLDVERPGGDGFDEQLGGYVCGELRMIQVRTHFDQIYSDQRNSFRGVCKKVCNFRYRKGANLWIEIRTLGAQTRLRKGRGISENWGHIWGHIGATKGALISFTYDTDARNTA